MLHLNVMLTVKNDPIGKLAISTM